MGSNPNSGCGTWALPLSGLNFTFHLLKVGLGPTPQGVAGISRGLAPGTCRLITVPLPHTRKLRHSPCLSWRWRPPAVSKSPPGWGKVPRGPRPCGDRGGSSSMLSTTAYRAACGDSHSHRPLEGLRREEGFTQGLPGQPTFPTQPVQAWLLWALPAPGPDTATPTAGPGAWCHLRKLILLLHGLLLVGTGVGHR